jgi:4-methylaminobutanoate oxidase (formaldehyde-forming)
LGFAVRAGREFLGQAALPAAPGGPSRLVCLVLDDPRSVALGNEPVRDAGGAVVGRVSSGGLGYSLDRSIAYAWLPAAQAAVGTALSVEVFGEIVGAAVAAEPLFDPAGDRIRA